MYVWIQTHMRARQKKKWSCPRRETHTHTKKGTVWPSTRDVEKKMGVLLIRLVLYEHQTGHLHGPCIAFANVDLGKWSEHENVVSRWVRKRHELLE